MDFTPFLLFFGAIFANLITLALVKRWFDRQKQAAIELFEDYIKPRGTEPSKFEAHIDQISIRAGLGIARSLKASFMNSQSIEARQSAIVEEAVLTDMANQANPLAGAILESFPTLKKKIMKNPALAQMGMNLLTRFTAKPDAALSGGNGHGESTITQRRVNDG